MEPTQGPTIQEVITQVTLLITEIGAITTVVSLGVTQFVKQFTNSSKVIAVFALVFGFFAGLTLMKLFNGSFFSPLSLLVGGIAALGAPGIFSLTKTLTTKTVPQE